MSLMIVVRKPSFVTASWKVPSGNCGKLNSPFASLTIVLSCPVAGLLRWTVAPATTAPWESRTTPATRPGNSWASAKVLPTTQSNKADVTMRTTLRFFMAIPHFWRMLLRKQIVCQWYSNGMSNPYFSKIRPDNVRGDPDENGRTCDRSWDLEVLGYCWRRGGIF